jgi:integrase
LRGERQRDRILTHEEEQAYLTAACPLLREVATVLIDTGLRPGECYSLSWPHVHFSPAGAGAKYGFVHIPSGKTKFAIRNVPLTARAKALLEMRHAQAGHPKEGWVFAAPTPSGHIQSMQSQHRRALKDSGVSRFELYCFRHRALTRLGEAGADAFSIQKIAGHSSVLISQRYQHPTPERIESAFTALENYNRRKESEIQERGLVQ